jgi:hypothetical protein
MRKKWLILGGILILGIAVLRFVGGGDEDTWICAGGEWVKHGNPTAAAPSGECR